MEVITVTSNHIMFVCVVVADMILQLQKCTCSYIHIDIIYIYIIYVDKDTRLRPVLVNSLLPSASWDQVQQPTTTKNKWVSLENRWMDIT